MRGTAAPLALALWAALGCQPEAPVPENPTWAEDVLPILQANCFQCHGQTANYRRFSQRRWDVYDLEEEPYARLGFMKVVEDFEVDGKTVPVTTFYGALDAAPALYPYVSTDDPKNQMPPPPATRLSARDAEILHKWGDLITKGIDKQMTKGSHHPNHKPTLASQASARAFVVADEDGDQVLGTLDCGGSAVRIWQSGAHTLPDEVNPPCTGTLYDGFEEASVNLR
jgi:hypothetical protein